MTIHSIWMINKAGGLCYQKAFDEVASSVPGSPISSNAPGTGMASPIPRLSTNDYLVMASTFQSIHAIASKVSPVSGSSGIRQVDYYDGSRQQSFRLHCLQSPTGVKFLMAITAPPPPSSSADNTKSKATPSSPATIMAAGGTLQQAAHYEVAECEAVLRRVYEIYSDFGLKNPFYTPEMPIKSDAFDRALQKLVSTGQYL